MNERQYIQSIRERVVRFHRIPGVHLPIYEDNACIDLGKFLCLVRETDYWTGRNHEDPPIHNAKARASIAEHLVRSVQDLEELLSHVERLEQENRRLKELSGL
jgi:hypothetical protein